eukprot:3389262-Amphidinium_carterae.2
MRLRHFGAISRDVCHILSSCAASAMQVGNIVVIPRYGGTEVKFDDEDPLKVVASVLIRRRLERHGFIQLT